MEALWLILPREKRISYFVLRLRRTLRNENRIAAEDIQTSNDKQQRHQNLKHHHGNEDTFDQAAYFRPYQRAYQTSSSGTMGCGSVAQQSIH